MRSVVLSALVLALVALPTYAPAEEPKSAPPTPQQVLDEVNAARAARGLKAFVLDENLAKGAAACATYRAEHRLDGHTRNDFGYLPAGTSARAAGCAAWPVRMGWGSCCTYENYTYAGAAYAIGADGKRYMHLFVR